MNKQIEQVETIMTEYAERECISKEKENQTGTGFKQYFFSSDARRNGNQEYTKNKEELFCQIFENVENPKTLAKDFKQFIAYPYKLECHKHFASWSHYQHHLSHMKGQNLSAVQESNDVQTN